MYKRQDQDGAFVLAAALAPDQTGRLQALQQGREGAGVQIQPFPDGLDGLRAVLPQDQHDEVLRVGESEILEGLPVEAAERP